MMGVVIFLKSISCVDSLACCLVFHRGHFYISSENIYLPFFQPLFTSFSQRPNVAVSSRCRVRHPRLSCVPGFTSPGPLHLSVVYACVLQHAEEIGSIPTPSLPCVSHRLPHNHLDDPFLPRCAVIIIININIRHKPFNALLRPQPIDIRKDLSRLTQCAMDFRDAPSSPFITIYDTPYTLPQLSRNSSTHRFDPPPALPHLCRPHHRDLLRQHCYFAVSRI